MHKLHAEIFTHASGWHENPGIKSCTQPVVGAAVEAADGAAVGQVIDAMKL